MEEKEQDLEQDLEQNLEQIDKKELSYNSKIINEETNENISNSSPPKIILTRKMRWSIYSTLIFLTVLSDVDQGILSSSTSTLLKDFDMTERQLGGFGSMVFLGIALGCIFSFTLINKFNRKKLLIITISFDVISLFFTTKTDNLLLLYFCRIIAGFTLSFLTIYVPVWSDQFGIHKYKSLMMSIIHVSSTFGYLFGYSMGILLGWKYSFNIESIFIIIQIVIIIAFFPDNYFSMNLIPLKAKKELLAINEDKIKKEIKDINVDIETIEEENKLIEENKKNDEIIKDQEAEEDDISYFEDIQIKDKDINIKKESLLLNHLKIILKSKIFILMNITLSTMFVIVSAIQFWINDYMENGLLISNEKTRLYAFAFVIITSPTAGIILGGIISGKIGGYDTEKAIYIPLITSFLDCILANIIPFTMNMYTFVFLFWIFLFLGSILLPVVHGIILVSVDKEYAGSASSVSTLCYNFLGRLPGPNLYAFYKSIIGNKHSRIPFLLLLNMAIPTFISVLVCVKYQKEKYSDLNHIKNKEKELEEILNENKKNNNDINNSGFVTQDSEEKLEES